MSNGNFRLDKVKMPSILDKEIHSPEKDRFGHRHFAEILKTLIEEHKPPYSLGLLGGWGVGKSSVKELYIADLKNDTNRKRKVVPITFNAWRYGGPDIKRTFLRHVFKEIGGDDEDLKNLLYKQISEQSLKKRSRKEIVQEFCERWFWNIGQIIIVLFALMLIYFLVNKQLKLTAQWPLSVFGVVLLGSASYIIKFLLSAQGVIIPRYSKTVTVSQPVSTSEQYEDLLIEQLKAFKKGNGNNGAGRDCERLIVFVDDLDRLSAEEMVAGLDTIRTFLEMPIPSELPGMVFVISCDEDRVADAIHKRGFQSKSPELPGAVFTRKDARRFLDRIFQFRMEIPPFPKQDMRLFAIDRMESELKEICIDLENRGFDLQSLVDRMIHPQVQSPRNAIQILNAFCSSWWLAVKREKEGAGADSPGGLQQGVVTKYPEAMASLSALKVDFPDFYENLYIEPRLVFYFDQVFSHDKPYKDFPERAISLLKQFSKSKTQGPDDGKFYLKDDYKELRQFIAGIQDVHWPESILPLLLLNQDRVSRKFGDSAHSLRDSLILGDTKGVLDALGRTFDEKPLSSDDARHIWNIIEDLRDDSQTYQDRAASVVADLASRFPEADKPRLLSPLSKRLVDSKKLRCYIGVDRIHNIIPGAFPDDRRLVMNVLVDDLLNIEKELDFSLPSGQPPSLDEMIHFVVETVDMALEVWSDNELDTSTQSKVVKWLINRTISMKGGKKNLDFNALENWVDKFESFLLPQLGVNYTEQLLNEISSGNIPETEPETLIRRINTVLMNLWAQGEESRQDFWAQLSQCLKVRPEFIVKNAWDIAIDKSENASDDASKSISMNFLKRVEDSVSQDGWDFSDGLDNSFPKLLEWLNKTSDSLDDEIAERIGEIALAWSNDVLIDRSVSLLNFLLGFVFDEGNVNPTTKVIDNWISRIFTDLPGKGIKWLASIFKSLSENDHQAKICQGLTTHLQKPELDSNIAQRGAIFLHSLPRDAYDIDAIKKCMDGILTFIPGQLQSPHYPQYLTLIFPVLQPVFDKCTPANVGALINHSFNKSTGTPEVHCRLHESMIDKWPTATPDLAGYNPDNIFKWGVATVNAHVGLEGIPNILYSLLSMVENNIVSGDKETEIINLALTALPQHPQAAKKCILGLNIPLIGQQLVTFLSNKSIENEQDMADSAEVIKYTLNLQSVDQKKDTVLQILTQNAVSSESDKDVWLSIISDVLFEQGDANEILVEIFESDDLQEEQRLRLFAVIEKNLLKVEYEKIKMIVSKVSVIDQNDSVFNRLNDGSVRNDIEKSLGGESKKLDFANLLMSSLTATNRDDRKRTLATWIKGLGASAAIDKYKGDLSQDDVLILSEIFPNSKTLKKLKKDLED